MDTLISKEGHSFDLKTIDCPICGPGSLAKLGMRGGAYHRYGMGVATPIVRCTRCSLIFPNPFPIPQDVNKLYGNPSEYFEHHDEEGKVALYRSLVRSIAESLHVSSPSILDVGCGRAELLRAAQAEGFSDVVGLEFSTAMIEYARSKFGLMVLPQTIEDYEKTAGRTFDAVVLNAVLEHVYDPDSMIASASRLTRPGSMLYIDVPHEPNLLTMVGNTWNRLWGSDAVFNLAPTWTPYHVFGFNKRSLHALLAKHRFEITYLQIFAAPKVPSQGGIRDGIKAWVGTQINRVANKVGMAGNMFVWAKRV